MSTKKKLEGIECNPKLWSLVETICNDKENRNENSKINSIEESKKEEAMKLLQSFYSKQTTDANNNINKTPTVIPLDIILAMRQILSSEKKLEDAISSTKLVFTPKPNNTNQDEEKSAERAKWQQRMERLKLKHEERQYQRLTNNLDTTKSDDVTTKSMTYAASIGLNMIVAPLSFGCFMYFFAGGIFHFLLKDDSLLAENSHPSKVDIRRVIIGVVSGVIMLFIEMILFVIRTHEFDKHLRQKERKGKSKSKAFGVYSRMAESNAVPGDATKTKQELSKHD